MDIRTRDVTCRWAPGAFYTWNNNLSRSRAGGAAIVCIGSTVAIAGGFLLFPRAGVLSGFPDPGRSREKAEKGW